jgi:hypothetical protein
MMIDTDETSYWLAYQQNIQYLNILMTSVFFHQNIYIMNILLFHQNIQIMNILPSLNSNSLLLPTRIVRTFNKSLTAADIIKFTQEDEMKYLIIEHYSGNYFGFNIHERNKRTSAISIVQDQEEFMVMGWKVAKRKIEKNQGREYKHHQRKNPSRCGSIHYNHDLESK